MTRDAQLVPVADLENRIQLLRGQRVMLDTDLARLYGVETKVLNKAVKRNAGRIPMLLEKTRLRPERGFATRSSREHHSRNELVRPHPGPSRCGLQTRAPGQPHRDAPRNADRFPPDFMFRLGADEVAALRFQSGTSKGRGGRRYRPYAFSQEGIAMLSSVLRSGHAVAVNIASREIGFHVRPDKPEAKNERKRGQR